MKKKPSIVCLGVRDNEADMGRIVTKGRRQKEMLRNKEASCPPSLFLVFSLSLHLSLFSSVDIPQRQASKPSAFPSLYLLFSSVRDIDCFRPTHTRIFLEQDESQRIVWYKYMDRYVHIVKTNHSEIRTITSLSTLLYSVSFKHKERELERYLFAVSFR